MRGPKSLRVPANGLTYHVLEWSAGAPSAATVVLLHGFMDAAGTWDLVASRIAAAGLRVLAPDLRGFGATEPIGKGGYYYFPDYVHDVADVVDALVLEGSPLHLVGHSMGGSVATLYAGAFPERPSRLAVLEGAGPSSGKTDDTPMTLRRWIDEVRAHRADHRPRTLPSRKDALRRLLANHPRVTEEVLASRVDALARRLANGRLAWRADPLHSTRGPLPFSADSWKAFARRVTCPVLFVSGGARGYHPADEAERIDSFPRVERAELPDAGHMMHWSAPEELSRVLLRFLLA